MRIAFMGQKGGVGKSTLSVGLACELARRRRVLLLDADKPQYSAATWAEGGAVERLEVRRGEDPRADFRDWPEEVDVVIDCPGRLDEFSRAALVAADLAILPVSPSGLEQWTLESGLDLAQRANEARSREGRPPVTVRLLRTRWRPGPLASGVEAQHPSELWLRSTVRELQAFRVAMSTGRPVYALAAWAEAAADIKTLVKELRGLHEQREEGRHPQAAARGEDTNRVLRRGSGAGASPSRP
ncbi:MAG: ParA family protein [Polyangia bacterium]